MDSGSASVRWGGVALLALLAFGVLQRVLGLPLDLMHLLLLQWVILLYLPPDVALPFLPGGRAHSAADEKGAVPAADAGEGEGEGEDEGGAGGEVVPAATIETHPAYPKGQLPADPTYRAMVQEMIDRFMRLVETDDPALWETRVATPTISIYQKKGSTSAFKVVSVLENTSLTCFDMMSDALKRKEWDSMTDEARVVQEIDSDTRIVYVRTKGVMFTAARDVLVLSHKTVLPGGRLLNVTRSITHPDCPESTDGTIRMSSELGGMLCTASKTREGCCDVFQIIDGDPKGSIPKAVLNFVATQAIPNATTAMNKRLRAMPSIESTLARSTAGAGRRGGRRAVDPALEERMIALKRKVDVLEGALATAGKAGAAGGALGVESVRAALDWASPFMLAAIYFVSVYSVVRMRPRDL